MHDVEGVWQGTFLLRPAFNTEGGRDLLSRYTAGQMNAVASGILGAHDLSVALRSLATYLCLSLLFLCVSVLSLPSQSLPPCISALYLFHVSACICSASTQFGISGWQLANSDPVLAPFLIPISALITLTGCPDCPAFILYLYHYSHCLCLLSLPIVPPLERLCLLLSPRLSIYVTIPCLMILPLNSAFHTSLPHSLPSFLTCQHVTCPVQHGGAARRGKQSKSRGGFQEHGGRRPALGGNKQGCVVQEPGQRLVDGVQTVHVRRQPGLELPPRQLTDGAQGVAGGPRVDVDPRARRPCG